MRTCRRCGQEFDPSVIKRRKFCSKKCMRAARQARWKRTHRAKWLAYRRKYHALYRATKPEKVRAIQAKSQAKRFREQPEHMRELRRSSYRRAVRGEANRRPGAICAAQADICEWTEKYGWRSHRHCGCGLPIPLDRRVCDDPLCVAEFGPKFALYNV